MPWEMPGRWSVLKKQYFYALHAAKLGYVVGIVIHNSDEEETITIMVLQKTVTLQRIGGKLFLNEFFFIRKWTIHK